MASQHPPKMWNKLLYETCQPIISWDVNWAAMWSMTSQNHLVYEISCYMNEGNPASPEISWGCYIKFGIPTSLGMWTELLHEVWYLSISREGNWAAAWGMAPQHHQGCELSCYIRHGIPASFGMWTELLCEARYPRIFWDVKRAAISRMESQNLLGWELSFSIRATPHPLRCEMSCCTKHGIPASPEM